MIYVNANSRIKYTFLLRRYERRYEWQIVFVTSEH